MIRFRKHPFLLFLMGLFAVFPAAQPSFAADKPATLDSVDLTPGPGSDTVEILTSRSFTYVTYTLSDPPRLIVDPMDSDMRLQAPASGALGGRVVQGWRVLGRHGPDGAGTVDYLEFQLAVPAEHQVQTGPGGLTVLVRPKGGEVLPPTGAPVDAPGSALKPGPWSLERSLEFGLSRHRPVRISRQEVELAQMKVREARRAYYPAATLKASWTEGTASEVAFTEYSAGLQLEHPLYYSGRLSEAYRQSQVNLQVSEKRQHKVKADYALELAQEYYQLIGAKSSLATQGGLIAEAEKHMDDSRKRFEKGLLTRLELLNVEAQVNQAKFQRSNAENDVALARFKFLQKLSLGPDALVDVPDQFPAPGMKGIDLEEALQLAARYRPDIQVNALMVKFQEHEERIARAKGNWKVDLSGFVGQSASAFETEPLDAAEDYFIGIKASRAWGPHSTTGSSTTTKTSPKLGQTTRTDSTVYSGEFGVLDQLQGLSEIKQAQVNLNKARRELEEAKNAAFQETQEAFISYNKARLQLQYAKQKIAFREEQVKILKAQASLNEALPSQVLEAVMKVTEERMGEAQALSSYYVALAKLNKAIGLAGHYK